MDQNTNDRKDPGEAEGDGRAAHGYRNEVSWDGGKGSQPYTNQGSQEQGPATAREFPGGDSGDVAGRNIEQLEAVKRKPERTESGSPARHGRARGALEHPQQHEQQHDAEGDAEKPEDDGHVVLLEGLVPP